jgi:Tol biopolymer transport system component
VNTNVVSEGAPFRNEAVRVDLSTGAAKPIFPGIPFRMRTCSDSLVAGQFARSVVTRNLQTGAQKELYQLNGAATPNHGIPVISHNGNSVLFLAPVDAQTSALITVPTSGGASREIARAKAPAELQFFYGFSWSPDDRYIYFVKRLDSHSPHELFRVPVSGGPEESVGLKEMDIRDLDIAPDGQRIAFSIGAAQQPEMWAMENFLPAKSSK